MAETFTVGDVVRLKSGGPKMTIRHVSTNPGGTPIVNCEWFADNNVNVREYEFVADTVEMVPEGDRDKPQVRLLHNSANVRALRECCQALRHRR